MKSFLSILLRPKSKAPRTQLSRRTLRFEPLESRQLLSVVTLAPVKDNSLIAYQAATTPYSGGQDPSLYVGNEHMTGTAMRALIDFNLAAAGIPAGSTINSVTLSVYVNLNDLGGTASTLVQLHDALANWGEGTSAGTGSMPPFDFATNGDTTWYDSVYNTNPALATLWKTAGGDFSSTTSGTATLLSTGTSASFASTSQMVADVQSWLANPTANFGWLLLGVETPGVKSGRMIDSREGANPPTLTINYTAPVATNLPPTLAAILNLAAINENASSQTVNLTGISAGAGETQALSVTATSSNTALVANPTVTYTSPGATGSLSFQPVANQYGTAIITVTVHDAGLDGILGNTDDGTVSQTFTVTVNHVNQLPTLAAIANPAAILENAGLQTVNLAGITAGPGDSQTLSVTATSNNTALIANPTVTYTSPNATGSLSYQPVANQYGSATVTVTVHDAGLDGILGNTDDGTVTQTFTVTVNHVNQLPTLAAIASPITLNENAGSQTVNLTGISAGPGDSQTLSVTATSNNTALIPNPTVTYTSPNATGSLAFQPVANQYGTATVTVTVHDAGLDGVMGNTDDGSVTRTFTVTVNQVTQANLPPTLAAIANPAAILENAGLQTINLTGISAGAGETQQLQVTATSDNTTLLANPTVSYTSPSATGSLSYQPVANQWGTAHVTVTVRDAGPDGIFGNTDDATVAQTFTVAVSQVVPVNLPPTLDVIADPAAILENAGLQTVNLTGISAGAGESQQLQVTATSDNTALLANPTVTYASPNSTGSLSYQPVANQYGTAHVTVTVRDAGVDGIPGNTDDAMVTQTFTVAVTQVLVPPTVTIDQAGSQADPSSSSLIHFTVVFSEPVTNFITGDVTLGGTAGATTAVVTGSGATYDVTVSGMTTSGTVIATIAAGVAQDANGNLSLASTSTDNTVTFAMPTSSGPTISRVVVALNRSLPIITWNVVDTAGIQSTSITMDGNPVTKVYGPYGSKYDANYAGVVGALSVGTHNYVITATDVNGVTNTYANTCTVTAGSGPTIGKVAVVVNRSPAMITWNVADTAGIKSTSIVMDGKPVTAVYGPYGSMYDANYSASIGNLSAGTHNYVITATDVNGVTNTYTGVCTVNSTTGGPIIGKVVVNLNRSTPVITWNVADTAGIRSTSITVDGNPVNRVYGPYGSMYDANYAGMIGRLSSGSHNYVIAATGADDVVKTYTGTFTVAGSGGSNGGDDGGSDNGNDRGSTGSISNDSATVKNNSATVKNNWLVDYAGVAASVHASKSNVDAVFADY